MEEFQNNAKLTASIQLVYALYGLTDEEIAPVKGNA